MEYVLQTQGLTKSYKGINAVNNVNMNIKKGDIYGFIGPNGAGKTTIIRLVTGLAHPTSGEYKLFGAKHNGKDIYQSRRRVSAIVENPSLYPGLTAYENLMIQCKILGIVDDAIIDEVLEIVGLSYLRHDNKKVKNFSLGMRQRLSIAISLLGQPDFILLDEPMNGLDPEGIVDMRELILRLNEENNITFLISSHILDELSKIATKYGFIRQGSLIKEITTKELEQECRRSVELTVSDVKKVNVILGDMGITDTQIVNSSIIRIYNDVDISSLIAHLTNNNIIISKVNHKDESIEDYYLNLMGGMKHA